MLLKNAKELAESLKQDLLPYCERVEIAGSIRRKKPEVKDIELVVIPSLEEQTDLFGNSVPAISLLELNINKLITAWDAYIIKGGTKYKQICLTAHSIKLDLFIVTKESWGVLYTIRTGSSNYSHWLVTQRRYGGALPQWAKVEGGRIFVHGKPIDTPEEKDFFDFLGIEMPPPEKRSK